MISDLDDRLCTQSAALHLVIVDDTNSIIGSGRRGVACSVESGFIMMITFKICR